MLKRRLRRTIFSDVRLLRATAIGRRGLWRRRAFVEHQLTASRRALPGATGLAAGLWLVYIPTDRALADSPGQWALLVGVRLVAACVLAAAAIVLRRSPAWVAGRRGQ